MVATWTLSLSLFLVVRSDDAGSGLDAVGEDAMLVGWPDWLFFSTP